MRNTPIIFIFCLVLSSTAYGQTSLFNGKDLTGWKIHGTEKWFVQNGELICESGPDKQYGYLASAAEFKDFDLELEFFRSQTETAAYSFTLRWKALK